MREGSRLVLQLLADGRISVDEAHDLLSALNGGPSVAAEEAEPRPQSRAGESGWSWDQGGGPFSIFSPAEILAMIFQGLSSDRSQRGVQFD